MNSDGLPVFVTLPVIQLWPSCWNLFIFSHFSGEQQTTRTLSSSVSKVKSKCSVLPDRVCLTRETCDTYPFKLVDECFTVEKNVWSMTYKAPIQTQFVLLSWNWYLREVFQTTLSQTCKNNFFKVMLFLTIHKYKFHEILLDWLPFTKLKINSAKFSENLVFMIELKHFNFSDRMDVSK